MQTSSRQTRRLRDYTNIPFEIFIVTFSLAPFFVLAYFYTVLPERVPLFVNLAGEVSTWTPKSALSVFRVPLMAVLTQVVCLLMKYGPLQSPFDSDIRQAKLHGQYLLLNARLWDWLRWTVAFKMSAESVDTIFLSLPRFNSLARPAFITSAIGAALGVVGALIYLYKLLAVRREVKREFADGRVEEPVDAQHVYGGIFYFNASNSALFVNRYVFNFGNKWVWVFIACFVAYPVLIFWPA